MKSLISSAIPFPIREQIFILSCRPALKISHLKSKLVDMDVSHQEGHRHRHPGSIKINLEILLPIF